MNIGVVVWYSYCSTDFTCISITVIDCGVPPTGGDNSQVQYSVTTFGASATYSCTTECFELDSDEDTLICLSSESWSGDTPQCHCE